MARPWLGRLRTARPDDNEVARQQRAVSDLRAGRLPAQRLHDQTVFGAEMTPGEFVALRATGYEVAGQVFGTATYQISTTAQNLTRYSVHPGGWSGRNYQPAHSNAARTVSNYYRNPLAAAPRLIPGYHDGANTARATALRRLRAECRELHADGVVGVRYVRSAGGGSGGREVTVVGTAVRRARRSQSAPSSDSPFTTTLTAVEVGALARIGWRPVDLLYDRQRYGGHGGYVAKSGGGRLNPLSYTTGEIAAASTVASFAAAETRRRLAAGLNAGAGLLLRDLQLDTDVQECRLVDAQTDLVVDVEAVATSIVPVATFTVRQARPALDITPVVRLD